MSKDQELPGTSSVLEEDTSRSLAAVLKLARTKGYIDKETKIRKPTNALSASQRARLAIKTYMIDEKKGSDDRRDFRGSRVSQLRVVKEPEDYKPEINLEYSDDSGRKLDTKEAFKHLCYRFHGKGPGKNKIDRRLKKQELERKMKQALTTDVPSSAALMISKQEELKTPYIVLSKGK